MVLVLVVRYLLVPAEALVCPYLGRHLVGLQVLQQEGGVVPEDELRDAKCVHDVEVSAHHVAFEKKNYEKFPEK